MTIQSFRNFSLNEASTTPLIRGYGAWVRNKEIIHCGAMGDHKAKALVWLESKNIYPYKFSRVYDTMYSEGWVRIVFDKNMVGIDGLKKSIARDIDFIVNNIESKVQYVLCTMWNEYRPTGRTSWNSTLLRNQPDYEKFGRDIITVNFKDGEEVKNFYRALKR